MTYHVRKYIYNFVNSREIYSYMLFIKQLRKRDSSFESTHRIIVRLIRLTIETGIITGMSICFLTWLLFILLNAKVLVLSMGAILVLLFLPGHPHYYELASSITAKTYSNSMMAVLNSRIKVVSNTGTYRTPAWNESAQSIRSNDGVRQASGIVFRRNSETAQFF